VWRFIDLIRYLKKRRFHRKLKIESSVTEREIERAEVKKEQRRPPPEIRGGGKLGSRGSEEEGKKFVFFSQW
jgi:hypothetical protein